MCSGRVILSILAELILAATVHAQNTRLESFVGKDLRNDLNAQKKLMGILGTSESGDSGDTAPWYVWKTNQNGRTRYAVLLVQPEFIIPGGSTACIVLFGPTARRIASWCFQTGWRMTPANASLESPTEVGSDLIVIDMTRFINGRDVTKEYFTISNDQLRLVRLENHQGEAVQNDYVFSNSEIGLAPSATSFDEWVDMLESGDNAVVLSALTFLGGQHFSEPIRRGLSNEPQQSRYADLFQKLQDSPRIREIIGSLTKSDNAWVRQAAALAARELRERQAQ
jgi:hypothetical protein